MQDTINKINKINATISQLESVLRLLENSNIISKHSDKNKEKRNEFSKISFRSYMWTGSDNPSYEVMIDDKSTMNDISDMIKPLIKSKIDKYNEELKNLLCK